MRDVYFLGVDSGTQSTKVSIINQRGEVLLSASQALKPMLSRQPGWVALRRTSPLWLIIDTLVLWVPLSTPTKYTSRMLVIAAFRVGWVRVVGVARRAQRIR